MQGKLTIKQLRRIVSKRRKRKISAKGRLSFLRFLRRKVFQLVRLFLFFGFRLWLRKVYHFDRLPKQGPAIIVSNHLSYYDWALLSAVYWDRYLVFIGNKDLQRRPFVSWLMKLNILIFIDPRNPGLSYFKETVRRLGEGHILVIYPEGTRSKTGKMLEPKTGFVKIALKTGAPVIPVAMCGTYEILPPNKRIPALRRCTMVVGDPLQIDRKNPLLKDVFARYKGVSAELKEEDEKEIAFRIMQIVRDMARQEWDARVVSKYSSLTHTTG